MSPSVRAEPSDEPMGLIDRLGNLLRTYAVPEGSVAVRGPFPVDDRSCYTFFVPEEWTSDADEGSTLRLLEDGQYLGPSGVSHDDVRTLGRGRFSHWGDKVYFSASDNSDPNENGRTYSVVPPADWTSDNPDGSWTVRPIMRSKGEELPVEWTVQDVAMNRLEEAGEHGWRIALPEGWASDEDDFSTLLVLEDGQPLSTPHADPAEVSSVGQGRYAHLADGLVFSTSDNSDPRRNGRAYRYAHAEAFVFGHARTAPVKSEGHCWILSGLPKRWPSDVDERSRVRLLEDGRLLGPPSAEHDAIRQKGTGGFSHWGDQLWFSTSDNSDPNTNGRTYTILWLPPED
jgi:hypothetical protein